MTDRPGTAPRGSRSRSSARGLAAGLAVGLVLVALLPAAAWAADPTPTPPPPPWAAPSLAARPTATAVSSPAPWETPRPTPTASGSPPPSTPRPTAQPTSRPTPRAEALPGCRYADVPAEAAAFRDWASTLLDPMFRLSTRYAPRDLVPTSRAGLGGSHRVRAFVVDDLRAMAAAARRAGAPLAIVSAYRSYSTQVSVFGSWSRLIGRPAALLVSARPGHSEHQLGTTIDFTNLGGGKPWRVRDWGWTKAGAWLARNAWKYGFVMSYPRNRTSVTCYRYEPWHFRYFGREVAAAIHASGLASREWLWRFPGGLEPPAAPAPSPTPSATPVPSASPQPSSSPTPSTTPSPSASPAPPATAGGG